MQSIQTTDDLRETTPHGFPDFPLKYYLDDTREYYNHEINWHWHKEFEICYISQGSITCYVDQHSFTLYAGDGIFINSGILHRFTSNNYGVMPNVVFSPAFIAPADSLIYQKYVAPIENAALPYLLLKREEAWQIQIAELYDQMFHLLSQKDYHELLIRNLLCEAWYIMIQHLSTDQLTPRNSAPINHAGNCIPVMLQYIQTHYADSISLTDIANTANVSKNTALRYFQENIGISPIDYLIQYRIGIACRLLNETNDKIAHIAANTGYDNTSYFCRLFKKYVEMSPAQYRSRKNLH